jgi:glutamine phosphoribosylpyrophosphate amidotransferase
VTRTNCHPFTVGDWVGAHNGVISNSNELLLRAAFIPKGETDSESALCWLATHDFGREAVEKLEGNYAIAAMAKDGSRLVLAVDAVTTLHVAWVGRGLIWHKSGEALESSLTAARIRAQVEPLRSRILRLPGPEVEELATRSHGVGAPLGGDRSRALWLGGNEPF